MSDNLRSFVCFHCCPKCGGALFRECDIFGCDVECMQCGYVMPRAKLEALLGPEKTARLLALPRARAISALALPPSIDKAGPLPSKRRQRRESA